MIFSVENQMDYKKCCVYNKDVCGSYNRLAKPVEGVFLVNDLSSDTLPHLVFLKLKKQQDVSNDGWNERNLIENRLGKTLKDEEMIMCIPQICKWSWLETIKKMPASESSTKSKEST